MNNFAADLAATINSGIAGWVDSPDFRDLLVGLTLRLRDVLQGTSDPSLYLNADVLAAEAVRIACEREGIASEAKEALR
jgi:hypothetical protein